MWATEAVPEHSILAGPDDPRYFVAYRLATPGDADDVVDGYFNWSLSDGTWDPDLHLAPDPPNGDGASDPWTATFGAVGTDYILHLTVPGMDVGVFGTTPSALSGGGGATIAARTVNRVPGADGPSIVPDLGGRDLYVAYNEVPMTVRLDRLGPCNGPDVGEGECPFAWPSPVSVGQNSDGDLRAHSRVVVNPCTHRPIVGTRRQAFVSGGVGRQIRLNAVGTNGELLADLVVDRFSTSVFSQCQGVAAGEIPRCQLGTMECTNGAADACLEIDRSPDLATWFDPATGKCRAYVTYDVLDPDSGTVVVRTAVVDVTNDDVFDPMTSVLEVVDSASAADGHRDFSGTVVVDAFTGSAGVFFYRQEKGDPCVTTLRGMVRSGADGPWEPTEPLAGPFPSIVADPDGMGHYVRGVSFPRPGRLFVTWAEPWPTSDASCAVCQGVRYSLAVRGREVMP
ncbi:MAG: hypothetical protein D6705_18905 [Deltaproteobacteria bacterium]|nr:MAG: hypothetical protein D6705_18905 [Deltaproteobacteria bacterium]